MSTALREAIPNAEITWLVRAYTAPLLANNPDVDRVLIDDNSVEELVDKLESERFDAAIVSYARWPTVRALTRAGIPIRIGAANKLHSILFNKRIWQRRSNGKKHEADCNLQLLAPLGVPFKRYPTRLVLTEGERRAARETLGRRGLSFSKPVVILHPGSGGSSARWPLDHYSALGDRLLSDGADVIVTEGPGENHRERMTHTLQRNAIFIQPGSVGIRELAAIFSYGDIVVTNSTGPLHLAVALGVSTVSVFSPIPTCCPMRWGPYPDYVEARERHSVFVAPTSEDMFAISVRDVWTECQSKLATVVLAESTALEGRLHVRRWPRP